LRQVVLAYGGPPVLNIDELNIETGSVTAIVGRNGAGKSSLLRTLALLAPPQRGELRFAGALVNNADLIALRRRIGLLPQSPYLLHGTVYANVELGLRLRGVARASRGVAVGAMLEKLGLSRLAQRDARELSGGEAQKVALARVLVFEPEVLIFDEPFTHLDAEVATTFANFITECGVRRSPTVVFSSHDEYRAQALASRVIGIIDGKLAPAALHNVYAGQFDRSQHVFDTGRLHIHVGEQVQSATRIAIDPAYVVLSPAPLASSMRNSFAGRVVGLAERGDGVLVTVDAAERVLAIVSHAALRDAPLVIGATVWVSFKSSAVQTW
jgi:ABC-type sulfate/molybdate transport systems ATPase subunit